MLFAPACAAASPSSAPAALDLTGTSATNPNLARLLKLRPQADTDRDGVLTADEAAAYFKTPQGAKDLAEATAHQEGRKIKPDHADVQYGPDPANVLDLYLAKSAPAAPFVVYMHGGGFSGGDKAEVSGILKGCLDGGISVASINYRMLPKFRFPCPQQDGARAVQFLRSHASEWNIDPNRLGLSGGSAGAGMALWLALHDDLADPNSPDPVCRQSTRVACAAVFAAQTSYDPRWARANGLAGLLKHGSFKPLANLLRDDQEIPPEFLKMAEECSAINHVTKDAPPLLLIYSQDNQPRSTPIDTTEAVHHPRFGILLAEKMLAAGASCLVAYKGVSDPNIPPATHADPIQFFRKHLAADAPAPQPAQ